MPAPAQLYPLVLAWLQAMGVARHQTAQKALAAMVVALLVGQSLRPRSLSRTLPSPMPVPARQRYQRVARVWPRKWLSSAELTPHLVPTTLALLAAERPGNASAGPLHVALDSVRCGAWDVFTLGVVWHGRVLLVGWSVLPYPWPKKQVTPTVCALIRRVAAGWPPNQPVHLLADRGFPSRRLFQTLRAVGWGWTVRLRATSWVTVAGRAQWARDQLAGARRNGWTATAATYGSGKQATVGLLVIGRGLPVVPWHQRGPASLRYRAAQWTRRQQHLASKHRRQAPDASQETDGWVILFTSQASWAAAVTSYRQRWAIEGSYRDAQSGWDGRQGWELETELRRVPDPVQVERVVGLWALGLLVQTYLGVQVARAPDDVRAVVAEWTTTGRLSVWARGRLTLQEPSGRLGAWISETLQTGAADLAAALAGADDARTRDQVPDRPIRPAA